MFCKKIIPFIAATLFCLTALLAQTKSGYASVNGLKMYYEIHGSDSTKPPLVLIHGGGSTITTTFGTVLPLLEKQRKLIAVELQGHGHTADVNRPESFQQDADDIAELLRQLNITQADFFGFSNGASTSLQIAIRHPMIVRKLVVVSGAFKKSGFPPQFWDGMKQATLENMPAKLKEEYLKVAPNPKDLINMFTKDLNRMLEFKDFKTEDVRSIKAPTFIINSDQDVVLPEHAVEMFRLIPHSKLAILPGVHGECIGEIESVKEGNVLPAMTIAMIEEFLNAPIPLAK